MSKLDKNWKKKVEDFVFGMSDDDAHAFLEKTGFDFYRNVTTSVLGNVDSETEVMVFSGSVGGDTIGDLEWEGTGDALLDHGASELKLDGHTIRFCRSEKEPPYNLAA